MKNLLFEIDKTEQEYASKLNKTVEQTQATQELRSAKDLLVELTKKSKF